nr:14086_t:CDS:2 [Entrophospora candida]
MSSAQEDVISIQNDSLKKESKNLSLKSKIAELDHIKSSLELKVNELEHLKSEAISKPIVGGNDKKNTQSEEQSSITKSDNISIVLQNRPLGDSSNHDTYIKNDTEIIPKVSDEINISKTNDNTLQEILNMTLYLAQPENNMSSLIELNSQMAHSAEPLIPPIGTIPIVASTLMSPLFFLFY